MAKRRVKNGPGDRDMRSATAYFRLARKAEIAGNDRLADQYTKLAWRLKDRAWRERDRAAARKLDN